MSAARDHCRNLIIMMPLLSRHGAFVVAFSLQLAVVFVFLVDDDDAASFATTVTKIVS